MSLGRDHGLQDSLLQQRVPESIAIARWCRSRHQQTAFDEAAQIIAGVHLGTTGHPQEHLVIDFPAAHGRDGQELLGRRSQSIDPGEQDLAKRLG